MNKSLMFFLAGGVVIYILSTCMRNKRDEKVNFTGNPFNY